MRQAFSGNPAVTNLESMARGNMEWFDQAMRMFSPFGVEAGGAASRGAAEPAGRPADAPPPREAKPAADLSQDLDQLQRQLGEMQAQLERLTRSKG
jgi:polyhydroxyalkanoate synthesis regulator protein